MKGTKVKSGGNKEGRGGARKKEEGAAAGGMAAATTGQGSSMAGQGRAGKEQSLAGAAGLGKCVPLEPVCPLWPPLLQRGCYSYCHCHHDCLFAGATAAYQYGI